ncbi:hypothetical protein QBC39DRAFT_358479 [Podospora conica]|nr:hypothetical protein QBC39DRAFT_358479 [Schizothecium conicum]
MYPKRFMGRKRAFVFPWPLYWFTIVYMYVALALYMFFQDPEATGEVRSYVLWGAVVMYAAVALGGFVFHLHAAMILIILPNVSPHLDGAWILLAIVAEIIVSFLDAMLWPLIGLGLFVYIVVVPYFEQYLFTPGYYCCGVSFAKPAAKTSDGYAQLVDLEAGLKTPGPQSAPRGD